MKKTNFILALILILSILITSSCNLTFIKGSGNVITETKKVEPFNEIDLRISGNLIITQGQNQSVEITTDDNIMKVIETEVVREELTISSSQNILRSSELTMKITVPEIKQLNISGSGSIESNGNLLCKDITLKINGSGDMNLNLSAEDINSKINGSGSINLYGSAEFIKIKINGSGDFEADKISTETASVRINGSGDCKINASKSLNISVNGSGDVYYIGNPDISTKVSGSGSVQKLR